MAYIAAYIVPIHFYQKQKNLAMLIARFFIFNSTIKVAHLSL